MRRVRNGRNRRIEKRNGKKERNRRKERYKRKRCSHCKKGWVVSEVSLSLRK